MNDRRIRGAKLDRIAEQVLEQAAQLIPVGHHGRQGIVGDRGSVFLNGASRIRDSISKDRLAVGRHKFRRPRTQACIRQQVVNQAVHSR